MHDSTSVQVDWLESLVGELAGEFTDRLNRGEQPSVEEYALQHPEVADVIRQVLGSLAAVAAHRQQSGTKEALAEPRLDAAEPHQGGLLGDFRILREIGRGGMGVVYEAEQISLARSVALKVLPFAAMLNEHQLKRFKNEARAAATLEHPNIVPVHAVGCDRGVHYYAMSLIAGQSMADVIEDLQRSLKQTGRSEFDRLARDVGSDDLPSRQGDSRIDGPPPADLPRETSPAAAAETQSAQAAMLTEKLSQGDSLFRTIAKMGIQAAQGLDHAHAHGVIHRDIKPANLILDTQGKLWITDFGLARMESDAGMTMSRDIIGTLRYMSPEQAFAKRMVIDHRTDIYSLGATLYELLTLHPAYPGSEREELLRQLAFEDPRPPRWWDPKIPLELQTIVLKAMAKEPTQRYGTAAELADDLQRFLEDRPILARPPTLVQRVGKWAHRHKSLVFSAGVATAVVLLAVALGSAVLANRLGVTADRESQAAATERLAREQAEQANRALACQLVVSEMHRAIGLAEGGKVGVGILRMARSLEMVPPDATDLSRMIRENLAAWYGQLFTLRNVFQHQAEVHALAFSPDGSRVLTAGGKTVRVWDCATGQLIGELVGHESLIHAATYSPDGARILTGSRDTTARLWDAETLQPIGAPLRHQSENEHVAAVLAVAFSPDGGRIATGTDAATAHVWDLDSGSAVGDKMLHRRSVMAVAFSPDGGRLLTGSGDGTARVWDAATSQLIGKPIAKGYPVTFVAFGPDGTHILTGRQGSGYIDRWEATTLEHDRILCRPGPVRCAAVSRDGARLITSGIFSAHASVFDTRSGDHLGGPLRHHPAVSAVAISPDGKQYVTGSPAGTARLWEAAAKSGPIRTLGEQNVMVQAVAFSPDGSRVVMGTHTGWAKVWSVATGEPAGPRVQHGPLNAGRVRIIAAAVSPDGSRFVTGDSGGTAIVWDAKTFESIGKPLQHSNRVNSIAFSPNGRRILTGSSDKTARIWDAENLEPIGEPLVHEGVVLSVAFNRDGSEVLTATNLGAVRRWDAATGKAVGTILEDRGRARISREGKYAWTTGVSGTSQIWDTRTGTPVASPIPATMKDLSPDGGRLLVVSLVGEPGKERQNVAQIYDVATGMPIGPSLPFDRGIRAVSFAPDGMSLLLAGEGGIAQLWRAPPGPLVGGVEQIVLWSQVITGMNLDEGDVTSILDGPTWHLRRDRLKSVGGPPLR